jgi:hypothetical protein
MQKTDIDKLKALRDAWDKFKADKGHDAYYKVVWSYGIERRDEIAKFNDDMCLQLLREYRTIEGKCDFCNGYKGIPPCVSYFKEKSCFSSKTPSQNTEQMYRSMLDSIRKINALAGFKTTKESEASFGKSTASVGTVPLGEKSYSVISPELIEITKTAEKTGKYYGFCPVGHGYYNKYEQINLSEIFDILWQP